MATKQATLTQSVADQADALMYEYDVLHQRACKDLDCYRCYDFIAGESEARFQRPRYSRSSR